MKPTKTIETFLPIFPGFYCTLFSPDNELENEIAYLFEGERVPLGWNPDLDFQGYGNAVAEKACDWLHKTTNDSGDLSATWFDNNTECSLGIISVTSQGVISPKFYNYTNDSIHCAIELDTKRFASAFNAIIKEHPAAWKQYLHSHYSSSDGFMSHYPDDPLDWKQLTDDFQFTDWVPLKRDYSRWYYGLPVSDGSPEYLRSQKDLYKGLANGTHGLGACLDFLIRTCTRRDPEIALHEYIRERIYISEYITNYPETVT
jgi:hypothetical protein